MGQTKEERIENLEINIDSIKNGLIHYIKYMCDSFPNHKDTQIGDKFADHYEFLLQEHQQDDTSDLDRLYRLVTTFKPALSRVLKPSQEFDLLCDVAITNFNSPLNRIRSQINDQKKQIKKKGAILPGTNHSMDLQYYCAVCKKNFPIPPEMKSKLLNSDSKLPTPEHCNQPMMVQIVKQPFKSVIKKEEEFEKINIPSAELLMGQLSSTESKAEYLKLLSVGVDIGSSTSHLVFSRITLKRETSIFNMSNRFIPVDREVIYESKIIFTPLINQNTIDIEAIVEFCKIEYQNAGITPEQVDTGAVIVTGETAKKQNAAEIADRLSATTGIFVSATAGPNFESLLGAMGSGAVFQSKMMQNVIMNVDVGGGTRD